MNARNSFLSMITRSLFFVLTLGQPVMGCVMSDLLVAEQIQETKNDLIKVAYGVVDQCYKGHKLQLQIKEERAQLAKEYLVRRINALTLKQLRLIAQAIDRLGRDQLSAEEQKQAQLAFEGARNQVMGALITAATSFQDEALLESFLAMKYIQRDAYKNDLKRLMFFTVVENLLVVRKLLNLDTFIDMVKEAKDAIVKSEGHHHFCMCDIPEEESGDHESVVCQNLDQTA